MRSSQVIRLVLAFAAVCLALTLATCGGGSKRAVVQGFSPGSSPGNKTSPKGLDYRETITLDDTLTELAALEAPEGVDEALFAELKSALADALNESCRAATCGPPLEEDAQLSSTSSAWRRVSITGSCCRRTPRGSCTKPYGQEMVRWHAPAWVGVLPVGPDFGRSLEWEANAGRVLSC